MTGAAAFHVVVRADGSVRIGMGHVVRCLSLAEAVRRAGGDCVFACREPGGAVAGFVAGRGFGLVPLPGGLDEQGDAARTLAAGGDVVVVDHYGLGPSWWRAVRAARPLLAVDDVGRPELAGEVDAVLNQNADADPARYAGTERVLAGLRYVMLRPEFLARAPRDRDGAVARILVTLGGADPGDATSRVLRGIARVPGELAIDVLVGPAFVHGDDVRRTAAADPRVRVHDPLDDPSGLMAAADLAVTAGGSTVYECAFLGLPVAMLEVADNQARICRAMARAGAGVFLGRAEETDEARVAEVVAGLVADSEPRGEASRAGRRLVDGRGADRVAAELRALAAAGRKR